MKVFCKSFGLLCAFLFLGLASALCWPLASFQVVLDAGRGGEKELFVTAPVLLGQELQGRIIHSVQLSPVIDIYRVQEGRIWAWQEKIMSHNAGLPSLRPERGRFYLDPPWMILEGTGDSWQEIIYRVGTEELGRNELCVFFQPCLELWRILPGKRIVLKNSTKRRAFFTFL